MKSSLTVYKASAGSGKTFTLAIQYIKTLIEQESRHAYSHILAVTFTNKATAEMKDRILQQLYGIWKGLCQLSGIPPKRTPGGRHRVTGGGDSQPCRIGPMPYPARL